MKLSDFVMNFVEKQGVKDIFMLPGGGCIHLVDSLGKSELNFVCNLHEQASSIAADAYAQFTNNLGVCLVTTGPGGTNALTGLAGAWLESSPVLFISGQVQKKDMKGSRAVRQIGFQELDMVSIVKPITKYAVSILDPKEIRFHLEKAVHLATTGRPGPVWIDIPLDVQAAIVKPDELESYKPESVEKPDVSVIVSEIIDSLNRSQRPVILAGNGIRLSDSIDDFMELCNELKMPVLTTWKGIDFMEESHPLFVGRPGGVGQRGANFSQQNSDFFISIGARLDHGQTAYQHKYFAREAIKTIVDIDKSEIDKLQMDIKFPVVSDAKIFIKEFISQKYKIKINCEEWLAKCKQWQEKYPVTLPEYWEQKDFVNNYVFVDALSDVLPENSLVVPGSSGGCSEVTNQAFKMKKGTRMFNSHGLGAMGFGIPASIGACIASNKKKTVCIDGDGGFIMNIQELEVIRNLKLPIKFFVLNNGGYVSIRNTQSKHFDGRHVASSESSGLSLPDIRKNAYVYDIPYFKISDHDNIHGQIKNFLVIPGPAICEVFLPSTHETAPKTSVYKKEDGSFSARPMEDLAPFLDREEFSNNMIVKQVDG